MSKNAICIVAILATWPCPSLWAQIAGSDQPFLCQGGALSVSLEGLLGFLGRFRADRSAEAMAIGLIEMYGLSFRPTPREMEELRSASASQSLLKAIETAKMPPKPVPKQGRLAVSCEPVDCEVWLDGRSAGSTSHGRLPWIALAEGSVSVSARKANYEAIQTDREALIRPNELTRVEFHLKLSQAGLVELGAKRFQLMREALRNGAGPDGPEALRAAGSLYLHGPGGRCAAWSVVAWFERRRVARLELSRLREKYVLTSAPGGYSWDHGFRSAEARELEDGMRLMGEGQLRSLLEWMTVPDFTMVAASGSDGENRATFRAEGKSQRYTITLDSAHRPSEITLEPATASSARTILYSDYIELGGAFYPKTSQMILPDGVSGIEERFDSVEIAAMPEASPRKRRGIFR